MIPPFSIQIIVENALKHAFNSRKKGNIVSINVEQIKQRLKIEITDNGQGIDKSIIDKLGKQTVSSVSGSGTALQNLNARLMGLYGKDAELKISSDQNGTQVVIQIPYKEQV